MRKSILLLTLFVFTLFISGCDKKMDNYVVELESNPSTGYTWSYTVEGDNKVQIIESYEAPVDTCVGCPGKVIFTISGIEKGNTTVTFNYKRQWEVTDSDKQAIYEFKVTNDLKLVLKSKSGNYFEK